MNILELILALLLYFVIDLFIMKLMIKFNKDLFYDLYGKRIRKELEDKIIEEEWENASSEEDRKLDFWKCI